MSIIITQLNIYIQILYNYIICKFTLFNMAAHFCVTRIEENKNICWFSYGKKY